MFSVFPGLMTGVDSAEMSDDSGVIHLDGCASQSQDIQVVKTIAFALLTFHHLKYKINAKYHQKLISLIKKYFFVICLTNTFKLRIIFV